MRQDALPFIAPPSLPRRALLALPLLLWPRGGDAQTSRRVAAARQLRVAVPPDDPPFGFINAAGELDGIEPGIARLVAREMQCELILVPAAHEQLFRSLAEGRADALMAGIPCVPTLTSRARFALPTTERSYVLIARRTLLPLGPRALQGRRVAASPGGLWLVRNGMVGRTRVTVADYAFFPEVMAALEAGEVDAAVVGSGRFEDYAASNPGQPFGVAFGLGALPAAPAVCPGDLGFLSSLNTAITLLRGRGELDHVSAHYRMPSASPRLTG